MITLTVSVWHNVASGHDGRPTAMLDGYRPGDPVVCVFRYAVAADGRRPEAIAEDAFAAFNGHPASPQDTDLSRRYYRRQLRSLSFPGSKRVAPGRVVLAKRVVTRWYWRVKHPVRSPAGGCAVPVICSAVSV